MSNAATWATHSSRWVNFNETWICKVGTGTSDSCYRVVGICNQIHTWISKNNQPYAPTNMHITLTIANKSPIHPHIRINHSNWFPIAIQQIYANRSIYIYWVIYACVSYIYVGLLWANTHQYRWLEYRIIVPMTFSFNVINILA